MGPADESSIRDLTVSEWILDKASFLESPEKRVCPNLVLNFQEKEYRVIAVGCQL
jgi:hypothetical protein